MKKTILYFLFIIASAANAQVKVDLKVDSLDRLVGQQATISVEVVADKGAHVTFPFRLAVPGSYLTDDLELVSDSLVAPVEADDGRVVQRRDFVVTSFADTTRVYRLDSLVVEVDGKEYYSNAVNLRFSTIDVDTTHYELFFPTKDIVTVPLTWDDWHPVFVIGLWALLALALAGASFVLYRYLKGDPILNISLHRKPKLAPHEVALNQISQLKAERKWADEDSKEYYTQLTDVLRTYIAQRFGFSAMEMTSAEIIERLTREADAQQMAELQELFTTADLVKFARMQTLINENDKNLAGAIEFIQNNKVEIDPNAVPEPDPLATQQRRSRAWVACSKATIVFFLVAVAALLIWAVCEAVGLWMLAE